ncbi:MAG TPA: phosphoribosyltransferase family protein, partial [Burkholderiaceae bacterium]|nr:phosphoribosyltransferase family protein [Burkholderiaceae bacterium]
TDPASDADEIMFEDRIDAGRQLARALLECRLKNPVVIAIPRGGVPVAAEVARALNAPLDMVLVRKIGAPSQPELAIAAVADGASPILEIDTSSLEYSGSTMADVRAGMVRELTEIERRRPLYLKNRSQLSLSGRTAILVDDGIATGTTVRAAIRALRARKPMRLVLAVPVAAEDSLERLSSEVDEVICLLSPAWFGGVGEFYRDFEQTSDDEVIRAFWSTTEPE